MYNLQSNAARYIYTLSIVPPPQLLRNPTDETAASPPAHIPFYKNKHRLNSCEKQTSLESSSRTGISYCQLVNGYYFTKEARSDEKLRYTESDMTAIVRTVIFMLAFQVAPQSSLLDIINDGQVNFDIDYLRVDSTLKLSDMVELLDDLFGKGFSQIVKRPITQIYAQYMQSWQYYPFIGAIPLPSALDYAKLARFINAPSSRYSEPTQFMLNNVKDHRIPLQGSIKRLR